MKKFVVVLILVMFFAATKYGSAMYYGKKILVGGQSMWRSGVNYTDWSALQTFHVRDQLYFVSDKRLVIYKTAHRAFMECGRGQKVQQKRCLHTIGDYVFPPKWCAMQRLTSVGQFFFTAANKSDCLNGMRVSVMVEQSPSSSAAVDESRPVPLSLCMGLLPFVLNFSCFLILSG